MSKWIRHQARVRQNASSYTFECIRCGVLLPYNIDPGQIICVSETRIVFADVQSAVDCIIYIPQWRRSRS